ncbi:MAG TPA: RsmG family class I SAM-dependent methyltransferase [Actinomycetota bacterium]|nr:RsmG family class I SAM-dependent methyltransferase [Actinomycetota bacterium]
MKHNELLSGLQALNLPFPIEERHIERLSRLDELLAQRAVPRGLMGEHEIGRMLPRHILECAGLLRWIGVPADFVDVGSGAGLPGLVLGCLDVGSIVLLEAQARRAAFLREAVHELGLPATVMQARAEDVGRGVGRESFAYATSRALARPTVALELLLPLVRPGGAAVLLVGPSDFKEWTPCDSRQVHRDAPVAGGDDFSSATEAESSLDSRTNRVDKLAVVSHRLGGADPQLAQFAVQGVEESRWVMFVPKVRPTPDRYPRRAGSIRRRPLG